MVKRAPYKGKSGSSILPIRTIPKGGIYMAHKYRDPYSGKMKSLRHVQARKAKRKLKRLYDYGADRWYPWPVTWSKYDWDNVTFCSVPNKRAHLIRNYRGKKSKWLKTYGHRKNRRNYKDLTNYTYNKNYDFWWELY